MRLLQNVIGLCKQRRQVQCLFSGSNNNNSGGGSSFSLDHYHPHHHLRAPSTHVRSSSGNRHTPILNLTHNMSTVPADGESRNRLGNEKSPYLLQHAHNPVHWYPFGEEAIRRAKAENKVIFLSVGYATCHWCHVMEKESFESPEVAAIMNEHFINIKVDREERPDIDKIYMQFLLMVNKSGGWPMSVWLTPDMTPISAGTYFPPVSRWGVPSFKTVLHGIAEKWRTDRDELCATGGKIVDIMQTSINEMHPSEDRASVEEKFNEAVKVFKVTFDRKWGGFGRAPKFPECSKLNFLLHAYLQTKDAFLLDAVETTLIRIADGGIHDHVFGGFSRYSVDRRWHVPHFEKMLYDQAQLLTVFANAFKITRKEIYRSICAKTIAYLEADLRHTEGGYFSGEDADSLPAAAGATAKVEGSFYVWTLAEIKELFKAAPTTSFPSEVRDKPQLILDIFCHHYDVHDIGNVQPEDDPHDHFSGKNILFAHQGSVADTAKKFKVTEAVTTAVLQAGCDILHEHRKGRPRPELDTKLICSWNGLMLSGLSHVVAISEGEERTKYMEMATKLMKFIRQYFYDAAEKTVKRTCYGAADKVVQSQTAPMIPGFLVDYAYLIHGLLDYYVVTQDEGILEWARDLQETQDRLFYDATHGGYYYTESSASNVVVRMKEEHDGAEPCGNSLAITNLLKLALYFDEATYNATAQKCLDYFQSSGNLSYGMPSMLAGALLKENGQDLVIVVGPEKDPATEELLNVARRAYAPGLVIFHSIPDAPVDDTMVRPSVRSFKMVQNQATVYICQNKVCQLPLTDAAKLEAVFTSRLT